MMLDDFENIYRKCSTHFSNALLAFLFLRSSFSQGWYPNQPCEFWGWLFYVKCSISLNLLLPFLIKDKSNAVHLSISWTLVCFSNDIIDSYSPATVNVYGLRCFFKIQMQKFNKISCPNLQKIRSHSTDMSLVLLDEVCKSAVVHLFFQRHMLWTSEIMHDMNGQFPS